MRKKINLVYLLLIAAAIWLATGFYTVESGENAVVLRFGKHVATVEMDGLHWHLPYPIEKVFVENVMEPRRLEFGYETLREAGLSQTAAYREVPMQSMMITSDENLVNVETAIQYRIFSIEDYLFNVQDQAKTLVIASEAAIRRVVANHTLDEVLTENKSGIQSEIMADLQEICNKYGLGINITAVKLQDVYAPEEVDAAFKDVANAREDKNSFINEANSYANEILPKARGNAAQMINEAEAFKESRIAEAKGDVALFLQILERYEMGKEVTRTRLYLETLEEVLPGIEKYIMDDSGGTVKFLPLEQYVGKEGGRNE